MKGFRAVLAIALFSAAGWAGSVKKLDSKERARAVAQAREVLAVRQSLLTHLQARYPRVEMGRGAPNDLSFVVPPGLLFVSDGAVLSPEGESLMNVFRDLAGTFRSLYVEIVLEKGPAEGNVFKTKCRQAVSLGARVFRHWGLPPLTIYLRVQPSTRTQFRFDFHTRKPEPLLAEQALPGVMVHLRDPVLKFGANPLLPIDLSLISRSGVRKWSLRLIHTNSGSAVKVFSGTSDVWVSLQWDGRDGKGNPAPAGEYQAFLTAESYGIEPMTDSVGFVVKDPPVKIKNSEERPRVSRPAVVAPLPKEEPTEPRRWAFVVHFARDRSDVNGPSVLEIRQLANTLKTFPNEKVIIEGFADVQEKNARSLAAERARSVQAALLSVHEVAGDRLGVREQDPRPALEGETMQKAVTFFVTSESP